MPIRFSPERSVLQKGLLMQRRMAFSLFSFSVYHFGMFFQERSTKKQGIKFGKSIPCKCIGFVSGHSDSHKWNSTVINRVCLSTEGRFDTAVWVPVWEALSSIIGHLILACTLEVTAKKGVFTVKAVVKDKGAVLKKLRGSSVLVWSTTPLWTIIYS